MRTPRLNRFSPFILKEMMIIGKSKLKRLLIPLLIVSLVANLYLLFIKLDFEHQNRSHNQSQVRHISTYGENLVEHAEEFIRLSESENTEEARQLRFDSWRIVEGEQRSIRLHLVSIQPHYMGELESKWSLLQYSLLRVDNMLHALTMKFLKQGSYAINAEELEKLQAAVAIYKRIHEEVEKGSNHPVLVIDELTELMHLIDPSYSYALEPSGDH